MSSCLDAVKIRKLFLLLPTDYPVFMARLRYHIVYLDEITFKSVKLDLVLFFESRLSTLLLLFLF